MNEVRLSMERRIYAIAEESIEKHSVSISNRSCLILTHQTFGGVPVCERSECPAASADDALPLCLTTPLHRMWSGRCLLHDMKHVERREDGECLGYGTQSQWEGKTQSQLVLDVIYLQQSRLSAPDLDHTLCAVQDPPWITFCLRTEEDNVSSLLVCLCRSCLQMCLCRGSLDLRRVLVKTAPEVTTSWTLIAIGSAHQIFRSLLYISLFGMIWTQCRILVCGQFCPTLTCHISSVELACVGPKGNI